MTPLVVLSHLRWDFVTQRPQHLMTRFARSYEVIYIEEPVFTDGAPRLEMRRVAEHLTVVRPHTRSRHIGFCDQQVAALRVLFESDDRAINAWSRGVVWCWTPMAVGLIDVFSPNATVYDCMDELSAFHNAPAQIAERERSLLNKADLVFTGGPSLYESKRALRANVHCFPSSVDAAHFARAAEVDEHPAMKGMPHPRLGFYGVIDERFDAALVEALARARPQWQFVFAGPTAKINPSLLPQTPNLHWLGSQPYEALPSLLAGWDVCLLPFAVNEATRYISPTKLLEYMAAEKPIVSTPIEDVAKPYGDVVPIAADAHYFIAAVEQMLAETSTAREQRVVRMRSIVSATSWDSTVAKMRGLIDPVLTRRRVVRELHDIARVGSGVRMPEPVFGRIPEVAKAPSELRPTGT